MPGGASKLHDVRKLADTRATLDLDIPVAQLPGLPDEIVSGSAQVHARLQFGRERGYMVAQVALSGQLALICQRCMGPMALRIDVSSPVLLLESEAEAEGAPADWETHLAAEGRLSLEALAAEELLLALPIVPLHADPGSCIGAAEAASQAARGAAAAPAATARPFEGLRSLLQRGSKSDE